MNDVVDANTLHLSTGIPSLDNVLQGILAGDNVVWQVDDIKNYIPFVHEFCRHAYKKQQKLIYFRFGRHEPLLPPDVEAKVVELAPEGGFEKFLSRILHDIEENDKGACYVFDAVSELAERWGSDAMLGNFFMLACPYLFDFDTATYFALLRNYHASSVIENIQKTAQVVIDVFDQHGSIYIHPLKVIGRASPTMYMLHAWRGNDFEPVTNSAVSSEILSNVQHQWLDITEKRLDVWTLVFREAQETRENVLSGKATEADVSYWKERLLQMIIARDKRMTDLAMQYLDIDDLLLVGRRMIGTGMIGGKAVGMLIAQAILKKTDEKWRKKLEVLDSFFIGSDVYYAFLVQNNCWWKRKKLTEQDTFMDGIDETKLLIHEGHFPHHVMDQFQAMLDYFGQSPIIVRSSSLLEDAYGNAFAGKYESIFCPNQGTPDDRMQNFITAVKTVYASTISTDALAYRKTRGLLEKDEQMALLVQRVSGTFHGNLFTPLVAGVGFSYNPFAWDKEIDPKAGVMRMVLGLGTRAVERTDDYTRLVALNVPTKRLERNLDEIKKYSQKRMDLLDLSANAFKTVPVHKILKDGSIDIPRALVLTGETTVTFDMLLKDTTFAAEVREMLACLQNAYATPVDIEFTANFITADLKIALLQCRSFQVRIESRYVEPPGQIDPKNLIFESSGPIIGTSITTEIDAIIYVVPEMYGTMPIRDRYAVARAIGSINHHPDMTEKKILIAGPGRWGTSSPELGIPVTFAEINNASIVAEIAEMHEGLIPDVSLGTHFFNDLVELNMLYFAIYPDKQKNAVNKEFFKRTHNACSKYLQNQPSLHNVIKVIEKGSIGIQGRIQLNMNSMDQRGFCYLRME